ncbi:uncharacterized protein LOC144490008, partial [Mustelus asterias]
MFTNLMARIPVEMRTRRWILTACALLALCRPLEALPSARPAELGSPLSGAEYREFFGPLKPPSRAALVCRKRLQAGCEDAEIKILDVVENHGVIPKAPVCSDIPGFPNFPDFCEFATHRCATGNFYAKRIICPSWSAQEEKEAELQTQAAGEKGRSMRSDYEDPLPLWNLPQVARPLPGEQGDLRDLFARLQDQRAAQSAGRLQQAVKTGDTEAVDRESQRLLWALQEAGS